jgi:hypothetical protein
MLPRQYVVEAAFAMEMLAKRGSDRIVIFPDEASVVKDPRKHGIWKVSGQHDVPRDPKEQHGTSAMVWTAIARI